MATRVSLARLTLDTGQNKPENSSLFPPSWAGQPLLSLFTWNEGRVNCLFSFLVPEDWFIPTIGESGSLAISHGSQMTSGAPTPEV